jgi:predicted Zn-dependent protease
MRRQFNVKLFCCLILGGAVFGGAVYGLREWQLHRNARILLRQADRAEEKNDIAKAIQHLEHYLGFEPQDPDAMFRLAGHLDAEGIRTNNLEQREQAFLLYESGLLIAPEQSDARRRQVATAMALEQFGDALDHLRTWLLPEFPRDAGLHHLAGQCAERLGRLDVAKTEYQKAIRWEPARLEDHAALVRLCRQRLNDRAAAKDAMDRITQAPNDKSARAWALRARLELEHEGTPAALQKARQHMERARALAPDDVEVLLLRASMIQALEKPAVALPQARGLLSRACRLYPRDVRVYVDLVAVEEQAGHAEAALHCADQGLQILPNNLALLQARGTLLVRRGRLKEARKILPRLRKLNSNPAVVNLLLAEILAAQGRWGDALARLEALRGQVGALPSAALRINELLGQGHAILGNLDEALRAYQETVHLDPLSISYRLDLAGALVSLGRLKDAIREYSHLLELPRAPAATRLLLTRALLQQALALPEKIRDWQPIHEQLDQAAREMPGSVPVAILQAEVLLAEKPGQEKQVRTTLEKVRDRNPTDPDIYVALSNLSRHEGDHAAALALLDKAIAQPGLKNPVNVHLARIRLLSELPLKQARAPLLDLERLARRLPSSDQQAILAGLGVAWSALDQPDQTQRVLTEIAEAQPNNLGLRTVLFELALARGQEKEADRWFASIRKIEGERGGTWRYLEATRLLEQALHAANRAEPLQRARDFVDEARKIRPTWARIHALQGFLDDAEGSPDRAIDHYQEAVRLGDQRPTVLRRLLLLLHARGRAPEADQLVRGLLGEERMLLTANLGQLAAHSLIRNGEIERGLDLARKAVPKSTTDMAQQLWLARVFQVSGKKKEAEEMLTRLTRQAPARPEGWLALVSFLIGADRKKEALAAMERASEKVPAEVRSVMLGQCREALEQFDQAQRLYDKAIQESKRAPAVLLHVADFYRRKGENAKALVLLRELLEKNPRLTDPERILGRRALAITLAEKEDHASFQEARRLIEKNLAIDNAPADRRAEILILATRDYTRKEAIRKIEDLVKQTTLTPEERFTLAELLDKDGEWAEAKVQYDAAIAEKGCQALHLAAYALRLIQNGSLSRAESVIDDLRKREPDSFRACNLQAQLLSGQKKPDEALALLRDHAKKNPNDLVLLGRVFENLARAGAKKKEFLREAEEAFRQHAEKSKLPARWLPLAEFCARQNRSVEALELCERSAKENASAVLVAALMVAVVQNNPQRATLERVDRFLKQTIKKEGEAPPLWLLLAQVRLLQKKYDRAEAMYQRVLRRDENHLSALNNLAWLLAVRRDKIDEGLARIKRAIELVGPTADLLDTRALLYLAQDKPARAIADLRTALEQARAPAISFHLALAYHAQKSDIRAAGALEDARRLGFRREQLQPLERPAYDALVKALEPPMK